MRPVPHKWGSVAGYDNTHKPLLTSQSDEAKYLLGLGGLRIWLDIVGINPLYIDSMTPRHGSKLTYYYATRTPGKIGDK